MGYNVFAYCSNNPILYTDRSGNSILLGFLAFAGYSLLFSSPAILTVAVVVSNQDNIIENEVIIKEEIKESYTIEEFEEEAENYLQNKYNNHAITVNETSTGIQITNSYLVTEQYDRQRIALMLERTGKFKHDARHISAEWQLHNMLAWAYDGAKDVDLEYVRDSRWYVEVFSGILKGFGYI